MNVIEFREWTVLLCPRCEGTFYDEAVLETLLKQPDLRLSYLRPAILPNLVSGHPAEADRSRVPCPKCQQEMTREPYSENKPMLVDRCPNGHGIWLDDGELGLLVAEWESSHTHLEPSMWEGLRRLLGMNPRIQLAESESSSPGDSP